tara:strand:+ start:14421 stop:14645 length:225 start_codon:yes stop_codon:yes gene_type:complete
MNIYFKAQSWCLSKGLKIYIVPIKNTKKCFIEIDNNGKIQKSAKEYKNQREASSKIWDLYKHIYDKNHLNNKKK